MGWLFEADAIDFLPAPPFDPGAGSLPTLEAWSEPADNKDAEIAFRTLIETLASLDGGGAMTTSSDEGDDVDDIIVIGGPPPIEYPGFDSNPGGGGSGGSGGEGGGSSGGGQTPCCCPSTSSTPADHAATRSEAADGAATILGQNWMNQEYGGFIYRDSATGQLTMGTITGSAITSWMPTADNMAGISSYSQIVGIVHSHGPNVPGSYHNYPSAGDWSAFDQLIGMGATNLNAYYIVGADGQLREYDATDRDHQTPGPVVSGC